MTKREILGRYRGSVHRIGLVAVSPPGDAGNLHICLLRRLSGQMARHSGWWHDRFCSSFIRWDDSARPVCRCVNRAPSLILANPNYVKKVVFPLEILPCVAMGSAVFHGGISLAVMLLALLLTHGTIPWTIVLIPFVLLPLLCATLGIAWFLSAVGVYIRDIVQVTGIVTTILLVYFSGVLSSLRGASRVSNLAQA